MAGDHCSGSAQVHPFSSFFSDYAYPKPTLSALVRQFANSREVSPVHSSPKDEWLLSAIGFCSYTWCF
jgi:hypothetical protein